MPPAKAKPQVNHFEDSRSEASNGKASSAPRKGKNGHATSSARDNGSALKELAMVSTANGEVVIPGQAAGMQWNSVPLDMLDNYRVAHNIQSAASFSSSLNQAILTTSSIARHSPTMARRKEKRPVARESLATAVRKHFNGAAVNEIDVVVELAYKTKHQNKAFRMRSSPVGIRKS